MTLTRAEKIAKRNKYFPWIGKGLGFHCSSHVGAGDESSEERVWPWDGGTSAMASGLMVHPICEGGYPSNHPPGYAYPALWFEQVEEEPCYPELNGYIVIGDYAFDVNNPDDYGVDKGGFGIVKPQLYGWEEDGRYFSMAGGIRKVEHLPDIVVYPTYQLQTNDEGDDYGEVHLVSFVSREIYESGSWYPQTPLYGGGIIGVLPDGEREFIKKYGLSLAQLRDTPELALEKGLFCCGAAYPVAWLLDDVASEGNTPVLSYVNLNGFNPNGIFPTQHPSIFYGFDGIGMLISRGVMSPTDDSTDDSTGVSDWFPMPTIEYVENSGQYNNVTLTARGNNIVYSVWQWEYDGVWETIESVVGATYSTKITPGVTNVVRCIVFACGGCITTEPFTFTVHAEPTVTIAASAKETLRGTPITLTATATDAVSYQWQISTDDKTWADISGATAPTYTAPCTDVGTYHYRCVVVGAITAVSKSEKVIVGLPIDDIVVTLAFDPETTTESEVGFTLTCPEASNVTCMEYHVWEGVETVSDVVDRGDDCDAYGYLGYDGVVYFSTLWDCYTKAYRVCADYDAGSVYSNIIFLVLTWDEEWNAVYGISSEGVEDAYADAEAKGGIYREY